MTFDNSKTIINLRIKLFLATILLLAYLAMAYVIRMIKFPLLGIGENSWTIVLILFWLSLAFMPLVLNYQFISFSDEGDLIIFRYFTAGITGGRKNSIEINKSSFSGYHVETRFFGLIESIVLMQKIQGAIARYPPIYISALNRQEKAKIINSLNLISSAV